MEEQEKENIVKAGVEIKQILTIDTQIKNCDSNTLFSFLQNYFIEFFRDIQELRKFIIFLQENKKENTINDIMQNFQEYLEEFRK